MPAPATNRLLEALSPAQRSRILDASRPVDLPIRTDLIVPGVPPPFAYFVTSGIASVVIELAEGGTAEVAVIGREGLVGGLELLGPAMSPARCFIQMNATALRIPFPTLREIFLESEEVRGRVLEVVQQQSLTMAQFSACNKLHDSEARLARWLLMVQDRVESETFFLTQEFLAQMLGTQRSTVAVSAGTLQRSGMITYSRGKITILSRADLEDVACDCYAVARRLLVNLFTQP